LTQAIFYVMNPKNIKAILFDSDGTLFQSEYRQAKIWDEILAEHNINIPPEDYILYAGKTAEQIEAILIDRYNLKIKKGSLVKKRDEMVLKLYGIENLELMPCAREAVEFFYHHPDFDLALCTNGGIEEVRLKLVRNGFDHYFSAIITKDDVLNPKPAPDIYLSAMKKLRFQPTECLIIEDTAHGLMAAKASGAYCFVVPNSFAKGHDFSKADKILKSLRDLILFFKD